MPGGPASWAAGSAPPRHPRSAPRPGPGRRRACEPPHAGSCRSEQLASLETHQPALLLNHLALLLERAATGARLGSFEVERPAGAQTDPQAAGEAHTAGVGGAALQTGA